MTWNKHVAEELLSEPRNLALAKLMGDRTAKDCAAAAGVSASQLCGLLSLAKSPFSRRDESDERTFTKTAEKIAAYFQVLPEDLFSLKLYEAWLPSEVARRHPAPELVPLTEAGQQRATSGNPEDSADAGEVEYAVGQLLRTLSPREERVIRMRFGIEDGCQHTLAEVASSFGVVPEVIRQVQVQAMRKLRHPSRTRPMLNYYMVLREV